MLQSALHKQPRSNKAGSYSINTFLDKEKEISRLKIQADAATEKEMALLETHGLTMATTVLDVACGPGIISCMLEERYPGKQVFGIDVNKSLLQLAIATATEKKLKAEFDYQDVYEINLTQSFDLAYCRLLFQHLKNPLAALKQLNKVIKPGGRICILDVNDDWSFLYPPVAEFEALKQRTIERQVELGGNRLIACELPALLKQANFKDIKVDVFSVDSEQLGMETFLQLTQGFKAEFFRDMESFDEINALLPSIQSQVTQGRSFGMASAFMISASK